MKISTAGVASSGIPMISSRTIMISRKTTLEWVIETIQAPSSRGIPEKVMM